jgi:biotin operon repressor
MVSGVSTGTRGVACVAVHRCRTTTDSSSPTNSSDVTAYALPPHPPRDGHDTDAGDETDTADDATGADADTAALDDPDIDRAAAQAVCDVLAAQPDSEYSKSWLPDETGLSAERVEAVVADLEDWGFVAVDEFDDVSLIGDSNIGDGPRTDEEVLVLVLQAQIGNELDRDWLPEETGWSEERVERVVETLEQRGVVAVDDCGEVQLVNPEAL